MLLIRSRVRGLVLALAVHANNRSPYNSFRKAEKFNWLDLDGIWNQYKGPARYHPAIGSMALKLYLYQPIKLR